MEPTAISRKCPPDLIQGYKLEKLVGKGGMGEVHRATQLSLGRTVAVKLLASELAQDKAFVTRFEKEAAALAALSHPHIVSIVDKGKAKDTYYLVMEFIDGPSLREMMRSPLLDTVGALRIGMEICRAIEYAHGRGVIHRDLKPENILFDEQAGGIPKVSDFGLAAFLDQDVPTRFNLTETHVSMGTLSYMAPEQRLDAKTADHRADIYSLGVILYELLVGEVPVGNFDPPSQRKAGIDKRLDGIIARCLKPDPAERYQKVSEVIADLEPLLPVTFSQRPQKIGRLERTGFAIRRFFRTMVRLVSLLLVLAACGVLGLAFLRSKNEGSGRMATSEALTTALTARSMLAPAGRISDKPEVYTISLGEGSNTVPLVTAGRAAQSEGGALGFAPASRGVQVGRVTLDLPPVEGDSVELVAELSVPERETGPLARFREQVLGISPDPRSALVLVGMSGRYAALTLHGDGQPISIEWTLQEQPVTMLGPPSPKEGSVRLELSIDEAGNLRAFLGTGKERRPIGIPVPLGSDWKKKESFGKMPTPMLACIEGACLFRDIKFEVRRQPPKEATGPVAVAQSKPASQTKRTSSAKATSTTRSTTKSSTASTAGKKGTSTKKSGSRRR